MSDLVISADKFVDLINNVQNLNVIDIRSQLEFETIALDYPAVHIPLHDIEVDSIKDKEETCYILCKAGPRAYKLQEYLLQQGFKQPIVIDGGLMGCIDADANIIVKQENVSPTDIQLAVQESVQQYMMKQTG